MVVGVVTKVENRRRKVLGAKKVEEPSVQSKTDISVWNKISIKKHLNLIWCVPTFLVSSIPFCLVTLAMTTKLISWPINGPQLMVEKALGQSVESPVCKLKALEWEGQRDICRCHVVNVRKRFRTVHPSVEGGKRGCHLGEVFEGGCWEPPLGGNSEEKSWPWDFSHLPNTKVKKAPLECF